LYASYIIYIDGIIHSLTVFVFVAEVNGFEQIIIIWKVNKTCYNIDQLAIFLIIRTWTGLGTLLTLTPLLKAEIIATPPNRRIHLFTKEVPHIVVTKSVVVIITVPSSSHHHQNPLHLCQIMQSIKSVANKLQYHDRIRVVDLNKHILCTFLKMRFINHF
jgi:hypothetical protein